MLVFLVPKNADAAVDVTRALSSSLPFTINYFLFRLYFVCLASERAPRACARKKLSTLLRETGYMITLTLMTLMTITLITLIITVIGAPLLATTICGPSRLLCELLKRKEVRKSGWRRSV